MKRTVLDKEARIYKSALRRGAGECFTMLSTESARRKFRPLVMWACTCDLAYDAQIEGSRALLLYDLIGRYHDAEAFLDIVEKKTNQEAITVFKKAMDNIRPTLEVKPKRVGGATYQVPMEVNSRRANQLAIRWIVDFSRKRREHTMKERLAAELMDASEGTGASVKRREDLYKMAESNRAFSHYRF